MPRIPRTPAERSQINRRNAFLSHVNRTGHQATAAARVAALSKFERLADPEGVLDPLERARRAKHLRSAYFADLAIQSARARRARRGGDSGGQAS